MAGEAPIRRRLGRGRRRPVPAPVTIRRLCIARLAGQLLWVAIVTAAGLAEPGYSEVRDAVSELGARTASHPWVFNTAVAIWGLSFIAAAVALLSDAGPAGVRRWLGP